MPQAFILQKPGILDNLSKIDARLIAAVSETYSDGHFILLHSSFVLYPMHHGKPFLGGLRCDCRYCLIRGSLWCTEELDQHSFFGHKFCVAIMIETVRTRRRGRL